MSQNTEKLRNLSRHVHVHASDDGDDDCRVSIVALVVVVVLLVVIVNDVDEDADDNDDEGEVLSLTAKTTFTSPGIGVPDDTSKPQTPIGNQHRKYVTAMEISRRAMAKSRETLVV